MVEMVGESRKNASSHSKKVSEMDDGFIIREKQFGEKIGNSENISRKHTLS